MRPIIIIIKKDIVCANLTNRHKTKTSQTVAG